MARLYAPRFRRERMRTNSNGVPIPATSLQMERVRAAVRHDYHDKPDMIRLVMNEVDSLVSSGAYVDCLICSTIAKQYCREFVNGF